MSAKRQFNWATQLYWNGFQAGFMNQANVYGSQEYLVGVDDGKEHRRKVYELAAIDYPNDPNGPGKVMRTAIEKYIEERERETKTKIEVEI